MKESKTITDLLLSGPTDENSEWKQEGRKRLDSLIEERDKYRERFLEAVEVLHTKETKRELVTTFEIAQKLTAEIHELSNELRRDGIPNAEIVEEIQELRSELRRGRALERTLEEIIRSSGMIDEAEITRAIHDKMREVEYLRGVLSVMAEPNSPE